jgi:hypothetical protein
LITNAAASDSEPDWAPWPNVSAKRLPSHCNNRPAANVHELDVGSLDRSHHATTFSALQDLARSGSLWLSTWTLSAPDSGHLMLRANK